ncbi:hypothetical protein CR513_34040, partial [Mucuna pruriens]
MRRQRQPCRRAAKVLLLRVNFLLNLLLFMFSSILIHPNHNPTSSLLLQHKPDSDESISDEDDDVFSNHALSLDPIDKQELPLPVRLDILKEYFAGNSNQNLSGKGSSSSFEACLWGPAKMHVTDVIIDKPLEDEVEMPDFNEGDNMGEVAANSTDEETNSADWDNAVLSTRQLHKYGPQSIRNEQVRDTTRISEALLKSKQSASASHATCSKANTSGIWKAKPRFSLPSVSCKSGGIGPLISNIESLPEIMKAVDPRTSSNLDGNHLEDDVIIEINSDIEPAETEALPHGFNLASMDDHFDNLQDQANQKCSPYSLTYLTDYLYEIFLASIFQYFPCDCQKRGNMVQLFQKSSRSNLQETVIDSEDSPEPVDSRSSSDNEISDQHVKITFPGKKMQTMAERFEEALGTSSVITEGTHVGAFNSLRAGIFGKVQQMMLKEKETDMDFWKKLQAGARPDDIKHHLRLLSLLKQSFGSSFSFFHFFGAEGGELGCIDVKIISRYNDGKLTVCHCSFGKYSENFPLQDNSKGMGFGGSGSSQSTIIFSPRVCNNVVLEVGNSIRIHPP